MNKILVLILVSIVPATTFASEPFYDVHCKVVDQLENKVLVSGNFTVSTLMKDTTVIDVQPYEILVGAALFQYPDGEISEQIRLTIKKHGKIAAQSLTDFDPKKPRHVRLARNQNSPEITCKPKAN